jgi:hypothetical protein
MEEDATTPPAAGESSGDTRPAILLAMAMFVLVVDTSLMNVSISAVVHDLDTTVSGVQSAIARQALSHTDEHRALELERGRVGALECAA